MTQALDAAILATAIRRGCPYRPDACTACSCREFALVAFRAALPAKPTKEMVEAIDDARAGEAYRAIRAHLLGEDA